MADHGPEGNIVGFSEGPDVIKLDVCLDHRAVPVETLLDSDRPEGRVHGHCASAEDSTFFPPHS